MVATSDVVSAVARYAGRLHGVIGERHHVASPLGAWLVLALVAPAARGRDTEQLVDVLGLPIADAADAARSLLGSPHPAVHAAAAAWTLPPPERLTGAAARWSAGLPPAVTRGAVPDQATADAWAGEHTSGLIERFPLDLHPPPVCVLASALATRVAWRVPFEVVDAGEFRSPWRDGPRRVLRSPAEGHDAGIVLHTDAGDLAVHRASADGLTVTSVIAAAGIPAQRVLAAAHDVARHRVERRSLFDLPLGDGPSWTVSESDGVDGEERCTAVLPAWSARSEHDLRGAGFAAAGSTLLRMFPGIGWVARQSAMARYDRHGFEAAAVTAIAVLTSMRTSTPGRQRTAVLRFDRPHAVVATAEGRGPWRGLPVFSAWVAEPDDAR